MFDNSLQKPKPSSGCKLLSGLCLALLLTACSPPVVPTQVSSLNTGLNRISQFRLQNRATKFSNGKSLISGNNGAVYLSPVPFVTQGEDNTCGQAVMTMLLQYWGQSLDYQTVVNENNPLNLGTSYEAVQTYLKSKGLQVTAFRGGTLENLLLELHQGRPVMALLDFGSLDREHYVLVVGYNARSNTLILHESRSGPYVEIDADDFMQKWNNLPAVSLPIWGGSNYYRLMFSVSAGP
ncbi:MAG: C39 family peptidase [Candidatus Sericytochromatia bacterium]